MKKIVLDANLIKKYHQDIVYNYSEYPTLDHWNTEYRDIDYKKSLLDWLPKNSDKPITFYVHIPFCEQLCWFCTCSKFITKNYENVKDYLKFLHKELDLLFDILKKNKIKLNVQTVYFGGGSPTFLSREDLKELVDKLKNNFDWSKVKNFTIETDPRRVDVDRLMYNHKVCGANRISFGMQDFDENVQRRVNRAQSVELFQKLLTKEIREAYKTIAFDLLVGQPGQTVESMSNTCDDIIKLRPTLVQLSLMAYKPWIAKYQIRMVEEGPLPDFLERKELMEIIHRKLKAGGYVRVGFESYALPEDPMTKAYEEKSTWYAATGHQPGGRVNFIAVGSSAKGNLGDDYYSQNHYDLKTYKKCLDNNQFPVFRGMKLSKDDQIRQHATQHIKGFMSIDFKYFKEYFGIDAKQYFKEEIKYLQGMIDDDLVEVSDDGIKLTSLGEDFSQNMANIFDKYDPPSKPYNERLADIEKAKAAQGKFLEYVESL